MAGPAGRDARDEHGLPGLEVCDRGTERLNYPDAFVAENTAWSACRDMALENVQVGSAYSGVEDPDDGVGGFQDSWFRAVFDRDLVVASVDNCFHLAGFEHRLTEAIFEELDTA
jgi:hypothetical protein